MPALSVESIRVRKDRMVCCVRLSEDCPHRSWPQLMETLCAARPNLSSHACVNSKGPGFAAVMNRTPLIHVLEHLIIDFQAQGNQQLFVGTSQWEDEPAGVGTVELTFVDDMLALQSISAATDLLNEALREQSSKGVSDL